MSDPQLAALLSPRMAAASFLSGDALDTAADWIAIVVLIIVPVVVIVVFWLVHILPEKIAEQRHHPQQSAINTLCLLSLFFGGLLWPAAWLWAYTRPVAYRMAYGTDKHESYFLERGEKAKEGKLVAADIEHLRADFLRLRRGRRLRQLRVQEAAITGKSAASGRRRRDRLVGERSGDRVQSSAETEVDRRAAGVNHCRACLAPYRELRQQPIVRPRDRIEDRERCMSLAILRSEVGSDLAGNSERTRAGVANDRQFPPVRPEPKALHGMVRHDSVAFFITF